MHTLRRIAVVAALLVLMLLAATFAYINPSPIDVDVGVVKLERLPMALAFGAVLALGWLLGLATAALTLWRTAAEKRRLRKELRYVEAELGAQRATAVQDAN